MGDPPFKLPEREPPGRKVKVSLTEPPVRFWKLANDKVPLTLPVLAPLMSQTLGVLAPTRVAVLLPMTVAMFVQPPPMPVVLPVARLAVTGVPRAEKSRVLAPPPLMEPDTEAVLVVKAKTSAAEPPIRLPMPVNDVVPSSVPALAAVRPQVLAWLGSVRLSS